MDSHWPQSSIRFNCELWLARVHRVHGARALIATLSLNLYWTKWSRRVYSSQLCNRLLRQLIVRNLLPAAAAVERGAGKKHESCEWSICGHCRTRCWLLVVVCSHQLFHFLCAGRGHTQISHFHLATRRMKWCNSLAIRISPRSMGPRCCTQNGRQAK